MATFLKAFLVVLSVVEKLLDRWEQQEWKRAGELSAKADLFDESQRNQTKAAAAANRANVAGEYRDRVRDYSKRLGADK